MVRFSNNASDKTVSPEKECFQRDLGCYSSPIFKLKLRAILSISRSEISVEDLVYGSVNADVLSVQETFRVLCVCTLSTHIHKHKDTRVCMF